MGGKDHYEIDKVAGDAGLAVDPEISTMAVQSRQFLIRAVSIFAVVSSIGDHHATVPAKALAPLLTAMSWALIDAD
ncbi:SAM-dependent methyltransferase, partial [Nocardia neocaledoniensis]|uniref:SAM-dependent methyltransferase n=1 Tax=Nocardia neocaledoniensis TaxID=236511 RepID=UPI0024589852